MIRRTHVVNAAVALAVAGGAIWLVGGEPPTTLTERQKGAITQKIATEVLAGQLLYGLRDTVRPSVSFVSRTSVNAAESMCEHTMVPEGLPAWSIWVNERLAARHYHRFMRETVPHEVAHLLVCQMDVPRWYDHHDLWSTVVRDMGATPVERHDYAEEE
jgi:hypothetical protein